MEKKRVGPGFGDPETGRVLGLAGVGAGLSELISLGTLAMQTPQGLLAFQGTIIPHPTVGEALWEAAMDVTGMRSTANGFGIRLCGPGKVALHGVFPLYAFPSGHDGIKNSGNDHQRQPDSVFCRE